MNAVGERERYLAEAGEGFAHRFKTRFFSSSILLCGYVVMIECFARRFIGRFFIYSFSQLFIFSILRCQFLFGIVDFASRLNSQTFLLSSTFSTLFMDGIGPSTVQQCREYELEQSICWLLFERWHHYWRRPRIEKVSLADSNFLTLRTFIQILIQLLDLDHLQLKRSMPRI